MRPRPPFLLAVMFVGFALVVMRLLWAEAPRGAFTGQVLMADNGLPVAHANLRLVRDRVKKSTNEVGTIRSYYHSDYTRPRRAGLVYGAKTDAEGKFAFHHVRAGLYHLVVDVEAHKSPTGQRIDIREGQTVSAIFELQPTKPFLHLSTTQRVFTPSEDVAFRCDGFVPTGTLKVSAYRLTPSAAIAAYDRQFASAIGVRGDIERADLTRLPTLSLAKTIDVALTRRDLEGVFRQDVKLGKMAPGMYLVAVSAAGQRALGVVTVTDLGLVFKAGREDALAYAVDLKTGKPRADVSLSVTSGGKPVWQGVSDAEGLAVPEVGHDVQSGSLRLIGTSGQSIAVATCYRGWYGAGPLRVYTYTDRPIYRPGQRVYYKSILRELERGQYKVPPSLGVQVRVTDEKNNSIYSGTSSTDAYGSTNGQFDLPAAAIPGIYTVSVEAGGQTTEANFAVAEYRKPEFEVTVKPSAERVIRGDKCSASIDATYYYGAPVADAEVDYQILRSPYWYVPPDEAYDEDLYEPAYDEGEIVATGQGRTDKQGRFVVNVPTSASPRGSKHAAAYEFDSDQRLTIHATVTDAAPRTADGQGDVIVTQGEYRLDVSADDTVATPGQKIGVTIHAMDYDGKPVAAAGELVLSRSRWDGDREILKEEQRVSWQADQQGAAEVTVTPKHDGEYRLIAKSTDPAGHTIVAGDYLWLMRGSGADFAYPYQDLDVRADRKLYKPGETAQIVINTSHAPATALLTIEGTRILDHRLLQLTTKSTVVDIPIRANYLSAVSAEVCFIKNKRFFSGHAVLNVSRESKMLHVEVTSDKTSYAPGEKASYRVKTTGPDGKPVQAEVSLGVVDEAIYALSPETTEPIGRYFYPKRLFEIDTTFSFPEVYLSGDNKAHAEITTRKYFPDTAFWRPATVTNARGVADFSFTMPDSLTTWRATCRAATLDTLVGQTMQKVQVTKPFLVRLEAPRFFTQGDQVQLAAIVHNLSGAAVQSEVGLDAPELKLSGNAQASVSIGNGETKRVAWNVIVPAVGEIPVRVWAKAGQLSDAMQLTLPSVPKGRQRDSVQTGATTESRDLRFDVRADCIPGTQKLTLRMTPSLAGAMLGALDYLAQYPYGCVEQTMSAFLPDVVISQMLRSRQMTNASLEKKLPPMVEAGLLKLSDMQHDDGGFGWWRYDKNDLWMTAYVVFGLHLAQDAGFQINNARLKNASPALQEMAVSFEPTKYKPEDDRAFAAYVLALTGDGSTAARVVALYSGAAGGAHRSKLTDRGLAYLAQAYALLGRMKEARSTLAEVWQHFEAGSLRVGKPYTGPTDVGVAAALLSATCTLAPDDKRLPDLVRWMLEHRQDNHWMSTRDTAFALYALSKYFAITQELSPNLSVAISVNGASAGHFTFGPDSVFKPETVIDLPAPAPKTTADVRIELSGTGHLYYTADLHQVVAEDLTQPVKSEAGMVVDRAYRKVQPGDLPASPGRQEVLWSKPAPRSAPTTTFRVGDVIDVTLTLRCASAVDHIMLEDPLPAGCEAQDRGRIDFWDWDYWWADQILRDQKAAFAIDKLKAGAHVIRYQVRAQTAGVFTALPPTAYDMYDPSVRGDGVAQTITIRP